MLIRKNHSDSFNLNHLAKLPYFILCVILDGQRSTLLPLLLRAALLRTLNLILIKGEAHLQVRLFRTAFARYGLSSLFTGGELGAALARDGGCAHDAAFCGGLGALLLVFQLCATFA